MIKFLKEAANVCPSKRQLDWFDLESYAFVHFGVNTYTDREWGEGDESESIFNPTKLDCDNWVEAIKSAGLKGMVLTAKHHDGFCLWPSAYTEHSVKNSPCKRDIVKEASDACHRGGIKFGFYLSPWDRNSKYYGTSEYNDYFCNQLTELLTNYGEIFYVWFDGACAAEKKQEYDFNRYFELVRKYQPNAVIFYDAGPDVRWCGNEAGKPRTAEWAVIPKELTHFADIQTNPGPMADEGSLDYIYNSEDAIGNISNIIYSKGLCFVPSEIDMSIRPGWFWHENEEPHSLQRLFRTYITSVGANACLNLNVPPTKEGLIDERDAKRLKELGELIKNEFGNPVSVNITKIADCPPTQPKYQIKLDKPQKNIKYVVLAEDIAKGQRVESFRITVNGQELMAVYEGKCIGHKCICQLINPFEVQNKLIDDNAGEDIKTITVHITSARDEVLIKDIKVY